MEQKFNRFLWGGNDIDHARAKVAWNSICVPKKEGGLGLKKLEDWSKAAIPRHTFGIYLHNLNLYG